MGDRQALLFILCGSLLAAAGIGCWWFGADLPLHRLLRLTGRAERVITLSALGGLLVMGPLALAALALLLWRRRIADALWLLLTIGTGRLAVEGLKLVVTRPRPPAIDWLETVKSWSFPSSHSAGTMMTCLALALLFGRNGCAIAAALLAALVIGWSRVALAVHWPSDVLAGWGFGLLWLGVSLRFYSALGARPDPLRPVDGG
ncbi:MAG TPA: phosphatase PAP2 family protein [Sphingomonas sp.]|nr:phosphatase PAP2 family protein [Sphingomonas sp.]